MQIIFFSSNFDIIEEWKQRHFIESSVSCYDLETLNKEIENINEFILIVDYDSVANDFNKLISSGTVPNNVIVLEKAPEIATGKMLISNNVKAYGNSRMLTIHYVQMLEAVINKKVWTYPELTAALVKENKQPSINDDSKELIQNRLSPKEVEVVYLILDGLTNNAIASKLDITTRTVKAHISSIFLKLHVNDRISLVLLLK
ncbi:response regulator transcription factor [Sulfurimonas sp.]